ncbi:hypothetical protein DIPPA_09382 [Diplonema papillatum]|nr:hypothetical protein DIPPA_09382 [Diplonema papillatum]
MPVYVDKDGVPRQVHQGYEGTKYREYASVGKPIRWHRAGLSVVGFLAASYAYFSVATLIEERAARLTREDRRVKLEELRSKDPAFFNAALSRGLVQIAGPSSVETPVDMREVLKKAFPDYIPELKTPKDG